MNKGDPVTHYAHCPWVIVIVHAVKNLYGKCEFYPFGSSRDSIFCCTRAQKPSVYLNTRTYLAPAFILSEAVNTSMQWNKTSWS